MAWLANSETELPTYRIANRWRACSLSPSTPHACACCVCGWGEGARARACVCICVYSSPCLPRPLDLPTPTSFAWAEEREQTRDGGWQRDVPGMSRSAVRPLTEAGVKAISVGVNPASAPPGVPANQPFWWRDPSSGSQILAMWHPGWPIHAPHPLLHKFANISWRFTCRRLRFSCRAACRSADSPELILILFRPLSLNLSFCRRWLYVLGKAF